MFRTRLHAIHELWTTSFERGRGGLGPKIYVPKMAQQDFNDCKFYCLWQGTLK